MSISLRVTETIILDNFFNSDKSEFLAIYGRRRVGKTFLIKHYFGKKKCIFISITGIEKGSFLKQREECCKQISDAFYDGATLEVPADWFKMFELLNKAITKLPTDRKVVLFFDEFPWLATPRSRLLQALEYYWNQYWSNNKRIRVIICGSLASWIIKNIINNTGGLYNRVTYRLKLEPFNLFETKAFLKTKGIRLNDEQVLSIYSVLGGIPLYLEQVKKGLSADQNIEKICFNKNGLLIDELQGLFKSLFSDAEIYIKLIREIAKHRYGITKSGLAKRLGIVQSGRLVERLQELEDAGFIISFLPYQHREKGMYFRIIDEYTMFYFRWIEPNLRSIKQFAKSTRFWLELAHSSAYKSWSGYAFESICYKHIAQIMEKLSLNASALPYTWKYIPKQGNLERGAQIDLLFDRNDGAITLCEIKYTEAPFIIDKQYAEILNRKTVIFQEKTKTSKQIFFTMISAKGIKKTLYSEEIIHGVVILEDLFKRV